MYRWRRCFRALRRGRRDRNACAKFSCSLDYGGRELLCFDGTEPGKKGIDLKAGALPSKVRGAERRCSCSGKGIEYLSSVLFSFEDLRDKFYRVRRRQTQPAMPTQVQVMLECQVNILSMRNGGRFSHKCFLVGSKQLRKHIIDFHLEHVGVPLEEIREIVPDDFPHKSID